MPPRFRVFEGAKNSTANENVFVGYTIFSLGQDVRIVAGTFAGVQGTVISPHTAHQATGTVILSGESRLKPVSLEAVIEGRVVVLRVPPELLQPA